LEEEEMKDEKVIVILEEIREMANHWYEDYCHDKCHEVAEYCTKILGEIKEKTK
jgi:hypothetical protein